MRVLGVLIFALLLTAGMAQVDTILDFSASSSSVTQGGQVTFTCTSSGTYPHDTIRIVKYVSDELSDTITSNGDIPQNLRATGRYQSNYRMISDTSHEVTLTITGLRREDAGMYMCTVPGTAVSSRIDLQIPSGMSCPMLACERLYCPAGYAHDQNGCLTCECHEPCEGVQCPVGETCKAVKNCLGDQGPTCLPQFTSQCYDANMACKLPSSRGNCGEDEIRYFYNASTKECQQFVYGGCEGNLNNFHLLSDCIRGCKPEVCRLPPEVGPCRAIDPRWFFNATSATCQPFNYGGCQGNENRFSSRQECINTCGAIPTPRPTCNPVCALQCQYGFEKDANGCNICQCKLNPCDVVRCTARQQCLLEEDKCTNGSCEYVPVCVDRQDVCNLPPDAGPCSQRLPRFFFNSTADICQQFLYGGCNGNQNRFLEQTICSNFCRAGECQPCEFGRSQTDGDGDGCRDCLDNPCNAHQCSAGYSCKAEQQCSRSPQGVEQCDWTPICYDGVEACRTPLDRGTGTQSLERFFYNATSGRCEAFLYTGVGGNINNFFKLADCNRMREGVPCVTCPFDDCSTCFFGCARDDRGCNRCLPGPCQDPSSPGCSPGNRCRSDRICTSSPVGESCRWDISCYDAQQACREPRDPGYCNSADREGTSNAGRTYFFYNKNNGQCEAFIYFGCGGNSNRFYRKEECETMVREAQCPLCPNVVDCRKCRFGCVIGADGCDICRPHPCTENKCGLGEQCKALQEKNRWSFYCFNAQLACRASPDRGPCTEHLKRYYYNATLQKCEEFDYGGCQGGANNFMDRQDCQDICYYTPWIRNKCVDQTKYEQADVNVDLSRVLPLQGEKRGPCHEDLQDALNTLYYSPDADIFIPRCTYDGAYESVQCHQRLGYCWCVDCNTGERLADTESLGYPNCANNMMLGSSTRFQVCPDGSQPHYCSAALCASYPCLEAHGIRCRINACGAGCQVELYHRDNTVVDLLSWRNSMTVCERNNLDYTIRMNEARMPTERYAQVTHILSTERRCRLAGNWSSTPYYGFGGRAPSFTDACQRQRQAPPDVGVHHMPEGFTSWCRQDRQNNGYNARQCHGDYCWCTADDGRQSLTHKDNCLVCNYNGRVAARSAPIIRCAHGLPLRGSCADSCGRWRCVRRNSEQVYCRADICNDCRVSFFTKDNKPFQCDAVISMDSTVCNLPRVDGTCYASTPRWYHDNGVCRRFIYRGCGGNGNNFPDLQTCQSTCNAKAGMMPRPMCAGAVNAKALPPRQRCIGYPELPCIPDTFNCQCRFYVPGSTTAQLYNCNTRHPWCNRHQYEHAVKNKNTHKEIVDFMRTGQVSYEDYPKCVAGGEYFTAAQRNEQCVDDAGVLIYRPGTRDLVSPPCERVKIAAHRCSMRFQEDVRQYEHRHADRAKVQAFHNSVGAAIARDTGYRREEIQILDSWSNGSTYVHYDVNMLSDHDGEYTYSSPFTNLDAFVRRSEFDPVVVLHDGERYEGHVVHCEWVRIPPAGGVPPIEDDAGVIAAIVLAVLAALVILAIIAWFCCCGLCRKNNTNDEYTVRSDGREQVTIGKNGGEYREDAKVRGDVNVNVHKPKADVVVDVTRPRADVEVRRPEVDVNVRRPEVEVRKPMAAVSVQKPDVDVDIPRTRADYKVDVRKPDIDISVKKPVVDVDAPRARLDYSADMRRPDVDISVRKPVVDVNSPRARLDYDVDVREPDMNVSVRKPVLDVDAPRTRLDYDFDVRKPDMDINVRKPVVEVDAPRPRLDYDVDMKKPGMDMSVRKPVVDVDTPRTRLDYDVDMRKPDMDVSVRKPVVEVDAPRPRLDYDVEVRKPGMDVSVRKPVVDLDAPRTRLDYDVDVRKPDVDMSVHKPVVEVDAPKAHLDYDAELQKPDMNVGVRKPVIDVDAPRARLDHGVSVQKPDVDIHQMDKLRANYGKDYDVPHARGGYEINSGKPGIDFDISGPRQDVVIINKPDADLAIRNSRAQVDLPHSQAEVKVDARYPHGDTDINISGPKTDLGLNTHKPRGDFDINLPRADVNLDTRYHRQDIDVNLPRRDMDVTLSKPRTDIDLEVRKPRADIDVSIPSGQDLDLRTDRTNIREPYIDVRTRQTSDTPDINVVQPRSSGTELRRQSSDFDNNVHKPIADVSLPSIQRTRDVIDIDVPSGRGEVDVDVRQPRSKYSGTDIDLDIRQPRANVEYRRSVEQPGVSHSSADHIAYTTTPPEHETVHLLNMEDVDVTALSSGTPRLLSLEEVARTHINPMPREYHSDDDDNQGTYTYTVSTDDSDRDAPKSYKERFNIR